MSFAPYADYKDSGVEWLGRVPAHWEVVPTRYAARLESGHTPSRQHPEYWENCTVPWFSLGDVWQIREEGRSVIRETAEKISELGMANSAARQLPAGTVMLSRTASVGFAAIMGVEMATTQDFANWVCGPRLVPEYLLNVFRAMKGEFTRLMYGSTHNTIYMPEILAFRTPLPPREEQLAIVAYVDRETAKIDVLVAEQERLIELLKEKRQAVISHAVTKGLTPDAPMKDSGIEWLGLVPSHWTVTKLKHLVSSIEQGWSPQCDGFPADPDTEWSVLKVGCVNGGRFSPLQNKALPSELEPLEQLVVRAGDLLISRANTRDLVGGAAVVDRDYARLMLCDKLYRLRFANDDTLPHFIAHLLSTPLFRSRIELEATGASSSMLNIAQAVILELPVAVPSAAERAKIALHVGASAARLDALIGDAVRAITLFQERRAALISAAVTGQIDVRPVVAGRESTPTRRSKVARTRTPSEELR